MVTKAPWNSNSCLILTRVSDLQEVLAQHRVAANVGQKFENWNKWLCWDWLLDYPTSSSCPGGHLTNYSVIATNMLPQMWPWDCVVITFLTCKPGSLAEKKEEEKMWIIPTLNTPAAQQPGGGHTREFWPSFANLHFINSLRGSSGQESTLSVLWEHLKNRDLFQGQRLDEESGFDPWKLLPDAKWSILSDLIPELRTDPSLEKL